MSRLRIKRCKRCGEALNCPTCRPIRLATGQTPTFYDGQEFWDRVLKPELERFAKLKGAP